SSDRRVHLHWPPGGRSGVKRRRLFRGAEDAGGEPPEDPRTAILRKRLEAAEAALEALSEGIVVVDEAGGIDYLNATARDLIGRRFDRIFDLAPKALRDACREVAVTGTGTDLEFESAGRIVHASVLPRGPSEGPPPGIVL